MLVQLKNLQELHEWNGTNYEIFILCARTSFGFQSTQILKFSQGDP